MPITEPLQSEINSVINLLASGESQSAQKTVITLIDKFPNNSVLHNINGACCAALGDLSSAVQSYEKALSIQPDYAKAHFNLAGTFHELGRLESAVKSYKISLKIDPNYAEAHNNLGNVFRELGELNMALKFYEKAIITKPDYVEAHFSLAHVYQDFGQLELMIEHLQLAIAIKPDFAEAHHSLGVGFRALGLLDDALNSYQRALELHPNFLEAHNNLGNAFEELGQLDNAVKSYKAALDINSDYPSIHNNLGNAFKELGQLEESLNCYQNAITINPDYADSHNNLGLIFYELNKIDDAVESYERALTIDPEYAEAHNNLGVSLNKIGQLEEAIKSYEKALDINPNYPSPYNNLTVILRKQGLIDDSINVFNKAIESMIAALKINPDDADTHNDLGIAFYEVNKIDEAVESYERALIINPKYAEAHNNLAIALNKLGRFDDAINSYEKAFSIKPNIDFCLGSLLGSKMSSSNWDGLSDLLQEVSKKIVNNEIAIEPFVLLGLIDDPALQRKASEISNNFLHPKTHVLPAIGSYPKHKKIRIGYFSADFKIHPVAFLTAELYEVHDRNHFEVHAFSLGLDTKDEMNLRIKAGVDHFHDVHKMSHKEVVLLARSLEIDIAIDLSGLTEGSRTEIFAMSAAPIQISYIGWLGTMGVDYYDYLIADQVMIPEKSKKHYSEKIAYLPNFQVNDSTETLPDAFLTRKDLGLPEEGFVFCCFNNTYKFTPTVFDSWARILKEVKGSVLIIYTSNETSKINLSKEIINRGIEKSRLIFGERLQRSEYLDRYRVADLFLDTTPYNAGTTASDALRMGLPVLTCIGESYQARMGASILNAINLPELITKTPKDYESLAIELATNQEKFKAIKDKLVSNLSTAPLYNTQLFTKNIESAYTTMYERHQEGLEPDHIYIQDSN